MKPYSSIETVFKRDAMTKKIIPGMLREPENGLIKLWRIREKIDGTNIRVIVRYTPTLQLEIKGRSDNAQIPSGIKDAIDKIFVGKLDLIQQKYLPNPESTITFYGEGYGPGIQGSEKMNYRPSGKWWRCFDIKLGDNYWIPDVELDDACAALQIPIAPYLGFIKSIPTNKHEMPVMYSRVSQEDYGTIISSDMILAQQLEGIVAKPEYTLYNASGSRVQWKLCMRDLS